MSCLPNILILGSNGQLGMSIQRHPFASHYSLAACTKQDADITDITSLEKAIAQHQPNLIINCAAYTAVDKAESEQPIAHEINTKGVEQLAILAASTDIPVIHLSTDYVFSGEGNSPYRETDTANPINYYGMTKYLGEEALRQHHAKHVIVRVSGLFSGYQHNFLKTILRLAREKDTLRIVDDQITRPTHADHLTTIVFNIADKLLTNAFEYGTYHYADSPAVSWHAFACAIINAAKSNTSLAVNHIHAIKTNEFPTAAKRPMYAVLDTSKLEHALQLTPYSWESGITTSLDILLN